MLLSEGLEELQENLLRDSSTLKSGPPDSYWSKKTLVRYINAAHRRFARRSLCIKDDTTPEVTQVVLRTGRDIYVLHESVLRVTSMRHQDAAQDAVRITHPISFARINPQTDPVGYSSRTDVWVDTSTQVPVGVVLEYATDEGTQVDDEHQIRLLVKPMPDAAQNGKKLFMRVIRTPLCKFKLSDGNKKFEIPEDYCLDMLEHAAYLALRNWDGDAEDIAKADKHNARFEAAAIECRKETEDKMRQPPTWMFGQGGFGGYVHN